MGIAVGNIVGSNILNVSLILGVAALVASVGVTSTVIRREVRLAVASVLVFAVVTWVGLSVWTAAILVVAAGAAMVLLVGWARQGRNQEVAGEAVEFAESPAVLDVPVAPSRLPVFVEPIRAGLGLVGVLVGAQLMVVNASSIATRFGVSQIVIHRPVGANGKAHPAGNVCRTGFEPDGRPWPDGAVSAAARAGLMRRGAPCAGGVRCRQHRGGRAPRLQRA